MTKLWGGRFEKETDAFAEGFHSSISFDSRLYKQDIMGSKAHANMLGEMGIITKDEAQLLRDGLQSILEDIEDGTVDFSVHDEDIHMNIERLLTERIGDVGKKLHTGRSRNDQVATDFKLFMLEATDETVACLHKLCKTIVELAEQHTGTVMCAYTHLQKAQPTTLGHYMMAYFEMFYRDITRLIDGRNRMDSSPLGAGALCATTYPIDRQKTADELGFASVTRNSLDSVSDRDFALEYLSAASICMMHLSRLCEELILFSTLEFGILTLDDAYSTGSSIMPQKKNPDMAELIRGKTGRVYGSLFSLLTVMKGLPLAYNKDMQEDKECTFDTVDTLNACLTVMEGMLRTARWNTKKMKQSAAAGFTNATDAADYFVKNGMAFRDAHAVIGQLVLYAEQQDKALEDLTLDEIRKAAPTAGQDFYTAIDLYSCIDNRNIAGGPAEQQVQQHIHQAKKLLENV